MKYESAKIVIPKSPPDVLNGYLVKDTKFLFTAQFDDQNTSKPVSIKIEPCARFTIALNNVDIPECSAVSSDVYHQAILESNELVYALLCRTRNFYGIPDLNSDTDFNQSLTQHSAYQYLIRFWAPQNYQPTHNNARAFGNIMGSYRNFVSSKGANCSG
jgi:hypothetical protein